MKTALFLLFAFCLVAPLTCGGVLVLKADERASLTKGWALKPILLAAVDVGEGEVLSADNVSQRSIPEQFVAESYVSPNDLPLLVGRRVAFALQAGDPIVWSAVAPPDAALQRANECVAAIHPAVEAAEGEARRATLAGLVVTDEPVAPLPALPKGDAAGNVKRVVAAQSLAEGLVLTRAHLVVADVPVALATEADVPAEELEQLIGVQLIAPLQKGDLLSWVVLMRAGAPDTATSCTARVDLAIEEARRATASREAKAWKPTEETP